jgi:hypothetical protein
LSEKGTIYFYFPNDERHKSGLRVVERFAQHFDQSPDRLGLEQVREYLLHLLRKNNAVASTVMLKNEAVDLIWNHQRQEGSSEPGMDD